MTCTNWVSSLYCSHLQWASVVALPLQLQDEWKGAIPLVPLWYKFSNRVSVGPSKGRDFRKEWGWFFYAGSSYTFTQWSEQENHADKVNCLMTPRRPECTACIVYHVSHKYKTTSYLLVTQYYWVTLWPVLLSTFCALLNNMYNVHCTCNASIV